MIQVQTFFENLILFGGIVTALTYIPQMWRMYRTKSAKDLSLLTYGLWAAVPAMNIAYVWLRQDWYMTASLSIAWLAAFLAFAQAVYYRSVSR